MDYRRQTKIFLIGSTLFAASAAIALVANVPLRAARWLPVDRQVHALTYEPAECLASSHDSKKLRSALIGRAAFRTPLLLGGQAARAGLSCNSCHRNGRGNPDFQFPGLSGAPGTADVTSSLMSSHRGDGLANSVIIPDLAGPENRRKISRDENNQVLEKFIRGLIVEEFDGAEPSEMTISGLANYVRMLSPMACADAAEKEVRLQPQLSDVRDAMQAAQFALDDNDNATARLMLASARTALGTINERYASDELAGDRRLLHDADLELSAIQNAIDLEADDISLKIITFQSKMPRWSKTIEQHESMSLFNPEHLTSKP
ncbi:MAG: hypothetical protein ACRERV_05840 [Methylococcales bacterium]